MNPRSPSGSAAPSRAIARPFLRVWFACSRQYARAPMNADGRGYLARCPTCGKTVRFTIGPGGTSSRFFEVSCR